MNFTLIIPSWDRQRAIKTAENLKKYDLVGYVGQIIIAGSGKTTERWGCVEAMAKGVTMVKGAPDVLVFCHDDIEVYEEWPSQVAAIFELREDAGLVGFHGAKQLGSDDIYRTRYQLNQLARFNPMSNMVDAEKHGKRVVIPTQVATVDGFFMAVRLSAYSKIGGWEEALRDQIVYHMYDSWMAMALREHGYTTWLSPVDCRHFGGGTEVGMAEEYETWAKENGFADAADVHVQGHKAFYERFRGQLPVRIK